MLSKLGLLIPCAIVAGVLAGGYHLLDQPIKTVMVRGEFTDSERTTIAQTLKPELDEGILSIELDDLRTAMQDLPWAKQLNVKRIWPDTIEVIMHRATPIARWGEDGYVSPSGDLLTLDEDYPGLPTLHVAVDSPVDALSQFRLLDQIFQRARLNITELNQSSLGEWEVLLQRAPDPDANEMAISQTNQRPLRVYLGSQDINARGYRFLKFYRRVLEQDNRVVDYIDARYSSGIAVRYVPDAADEAVAAYDPEAASMMAQPNLGNLANHLRGL